MDAILLAGGYGTRLRPLTYTRPKPLVPVAGRPMLEWVLDRLPPEVDRVIVAVNWLAEALEAHFAASERDLEFAVVREQEPLGTGGAMRNCLDHVASGTVFCLFADIVSGFDLGRMVHLREARDAAAVMALREVPRADTVHFGCAELGERGDDGVRLTGLVEKPATPELAPSRLINAGAYLLRRDVLAGIPTGRLVSFEKEVLPTLWDDGVWGVPYDDPWIDVGDPRRLLEAAAYLAPGHTHGPGCTLHPDARLDGSVAGARCRVGAGAVLTRTVLGDDVTVDAGVRLTDCVVGDGEHVTASLADARLWSRPPPPGYPDKQVGNVMPSSHP